MWVSSGAAADSYANKLCHEKGLQGRVMWFDADANMWELSTRKGVAETIAQCKDAGINTIVVDVKPLSGLVLYKSKIAPRMVEFKGKPYPRDYDLLETVIQEAHKVGIDVHAAINVFSEGSQKASGGPALRHEDWQCVEYGMDRCMTTSDGARYKLSYTNQPTSGDMVCLYTEDPESVGKLPYNTCYARVAHDGQALQYGTASGYARLSAPEGGYLLLAVGQAGEWLKRAASEKAKFGVEGNSVMRRVGSGETAHHAVFVNPLHREARAYALSVIKEICEKYPIDGIVLDRLRYPNIYSDFSDISRAAFEREIGHAVANWPDDVFKRDLYPGDDVIRGPLFGQWLKFRAKVVRDFLAEARGVVKSARSDTLLGIYVGSWYPLYYGVGVNWASPKHVGKLDWWPEGYEQTGYADLVDYMCTGCYYPNATRQGSVAHGGEEWASVEAAAEESVNAVQDSTFVYGSLYLFQYHNRPDEFAASIRECVRNTQGCMLFDLVYVRKYNWWSIVKSAFATPAKAPHDVPGLLGQVRSHESGQ